MLLYFHPHSLDVEFQLPLSRLQRVFGEPLTSENVSSPQLSAYIMSRVHASEPAGGALAVQLVGPPTLETIDGASYVVAHLQLLAASREAVRRFTLQSNVITDTLPNQIVLVSVRSDWNSSTFANDPDLVGVLSGTDSSILIDRGHGSWVQGFRSVFHLGTRHIAEGTDHLLFLLTLLLPAPLLVCGARWAGFAGVRHGFSQILKVVTAFTVGHSLTLALAASGLVHVPGHPIEVLIAISIFISAIHAARPIFPGREAFIAGGFGLIHGLAFASTLADLGLHRGERVASIFAFNVGIEAMQMVVVVCVLPSLMLLSQTRLYTLFRLGGAMFAGLAALGWTFERTTGRSLDIDTAVDGLAKHSVFFAVALLLLSLTVMLLTKHRNRDVSLAFSS